MQGKERKLTAIYFQSKRKEKNAGKRGFHRTFKKNRPNRFDYFVVEISSLDSRRTGS